MNARTLGHLTLLAFVTSFSWAAHAQTFSVIHNFANGSDGSFPLAGVTIRSGVLYGTASSGGNNQGDVYQITHVGSAWNLKPIYIFNGRMSDGAYPYARVVFGPDGHPYGTTVLGGTANEGTVFDLTVPVSICRTANCFWKETILHNFEGYPADGAEPEFGDLVWDQTGNIYGTTTAGGSSHNGTVYKLSKSGNGWASSVLHSFVGSPADGQSPEGAVIFDKNGNMLGTTFSGGAFGYGTVFQLTPTLQNDWSESILFNFNYDDQAYPNSGLVSDASGNLYGTSSGNGDGASGNGGTVFELSPVGDTWNLTVLYTFSGGLYCGPHAALTLDQEGNLYGTTYCDGAYRSGNVFQLTNTGNGWSYSSLYDFTGGQDGSNPSSNVSIDSDGTLYGTTQYGGTSRSGVVWMIKP